MLIHWGRHEKRSNHRGVDVFDQKTIELRIAKLDGGGE